MIRRQNLKTLIEFKCSGIDAECARIIDRQASYVSRLLYSPEKAGAKKMGEAMARHIERSFDLETNSLDSKSFFDLLVLKFFEAKGWSAKLISPSERNSLSSSLSGMLPDIQVSKNEMLCYVEASNSGANAEKWLNLTLEGAVFYVSKVSEPKLDDLFKDYLERFSEVAKNNYRSFYRQASSEKNDISNIALIEAWDSKTPLHEEDVELPLYKEVEMAAGSGTTHSVEINGRKLRFALSTLRAAGVDPSTAACATITGNSMERLINDGATIGIDRSRTQIKDGKIYAIDHGGMLRVKALYRMPGGGLRLHSENEEEHPDEIYTAEQVAKEIKILGWVFWWSQIATW